MLQRVSFLIVIILVFFVLTSPVCAQEADSIAVSTSPHHGWLYHFLFDSTLASRVPTAIDSERTDHLTYYVGGMANVDLTHDSFTGEIADTLCKARFVDIRCSDEAQYTEIERSANDTVEVRIYQRDPSTAAKKASRSLSISSMAHIPARSGSIFAAVMTMQSPAARLHRV